MHIIGLRVHLSTWYLMTVAYNILPDKKNSFPVMTQFTKGLEARCPIQEHTVEDNHETAFLDWLSHTSYEVRLSAAHI